MSSPDLVHDVTHASDSIDPVLSPEDSNSLAREKVSPNGSVAPLVALEELEQLRIAEQQHLARIAQLENALDQALICLLDLRLKAQDRDILEAHLKMTEQFSHAQHQAIAQLKSQIQQQQQTLTEQTAALATQDQAFLEVQAALSTHQHQIAELQSQIEFDRTQIAQLEDALHLAQAHPEPSGQSTPQQVAYLAEGQVDVTHAALDEQQNLALALRRTQMIAAERNMTIATLQKDLAIAQMKTEELETQLSIQIKLQARWQQSAQELEAERDEQHQRILQLEQETVQMQEQIFQQARQAHEYEAAIQYWKDHYFASQNQIAYFKELLNQAWPQPSPDAEFEGSIPVSPALLELLTAIQAAIVSETTDLAESATIASARFNTLDVPDFLVRRRNFAKLKNPKSSSS